MNLFWFWVALPLCAGRYARGSCFFFNLLLDQQCSLCFVVGWWSVRGVCLPPTPSVPPPLCYLNKGCHGNRRRHLSLFFFKGVRRDGKEIHLPPKNASPIPVPVSEKFPPERQSYLVSMSRQMFGEQNGSSVRVLTFPVSRVDATELSAFPF